MRDYKRAYHGEDFDFSERHGKAGRGKAGRGKAGRGKAGLPGVEILLAYFQK